MEPLETIVERMRRVLPGAVVEVVANAGGDRLGSVLIDREHGLAAGRFLRDDPDLALDYASNVTGVDWPAVMVKEKVKVQRAIEGVERELEETVARERPGYLEVVYHLYSMRLRHGPLILRMRTGDRQNDVRLPSLTPVWRSAELQEREVFDLFGIVFEGHPDLRRILMWDGFAGFPMRRDYVEPDDYEYEPTPHDEVLDKAWRHYDAKAAS